MIILTLGLAYPFAQSQLERFKMRNTYYGDLPGRFEGSGWPLFVRGVLVWFLAVVPSTAGVLATLGAVDWDTLPKSGRNEDLSARSRHRAWRRRWSMRWLTLIWLALAVAILYPIFQAMVLRWWVSGLRFGDLAVTSQLRTAQVYGVYARFLGYALLFTLTGAWSWSPCSIRSRACSRRRPFDPERDPRNRGAGGRLCRCGARLFHHPSGDGAARPVALRRGIRRDSNASRHSSMSRPPASRARRSAKDWPTRWAWAGCETTQDRNAS